MPLKLSSLTRRALAAGFRLGPPIVRAGVFCRPPSFNPATGGTVAVETTAACQFIGAHVFSGLYLGLAPVLPGTENLLIRAGELASIAEPGSGDYVVENVTGVCRRVQASRLDPAGEFYVFQTLRTPDEDWGDLSTLTLAEDFGDLTAETAIDDRMTLV